MYKHWRRSRPCASPSLLSRVISAASFCLRRRPGRLSPPPEAGSAELGSAGGINKGSKEHSQACSNSTRTRLRKREGEPGVGSDRGVPGGDGHQDQGEALESKIRSCSCPTSLGQEAFVLRGTLVSRGYFRAVYCMFISSGICGLMRNLASESIPADSESIVITHPFVQEHAT